MGYLKVDEIDAKIDALAANPNYNSYLTVSNLNHNTAHRNKPVKCMKIGKGSIPVVIVGGVHAREWAPPDSLVSLAEKLLKSYHNKKPFVDKRFKLANPDPDSNDPGYTGNITFDKVMFPKNDIKRIIDKLEIYIVPCANRDGREYSMDPAGDKWWRTNRRSLGASCPTGPAPIGVDINRNFPVGWDMRNYYNAATLPIAMSATSDNACDPVVYRRETYQGPSAASEPETQNIIELIDSKKPKFFLDVHSFQREIYYPWGINENQTTDDYKTFLNDKWDNIPTNPPQQHGRPLGGAYQEYLPTKSTYDLLNKHIFLGNQMHNSVQKAAGGDVHAKRRSAYKVKQSLSLYPAPGASDDYAFSTQTEKDPVVDPTKGNMAKITDDRFPIYAFTMESGHDSDGEFWPSWDSSKRQFRKVQREIHFAILGLLSSAAAWTPPPTATKSWPCLIATTVYESEDHWHVTFLNHFRDVEMQASELGKKVVSSVNRVYYRLSPQVARFLGKHRPLRHLTRKLVVTPVVSFLRVCLTLTSPVTSRKYRTNLLVSLILLAFLGTILALAGSIYVLIMRILS